MPKKRTVKITTHRHVPWGMTKSRGKQEAEIRKLEHEIRERDERIAQLDKLVVAARTEYTTVLRLDLHWKQFPMGDLGKIMDIPFRMSEHLKIGASMRAIHDWVIEMDRIRIGALLREVEFKAGQS